MERVRVLLADDHALVRQGLRALLEREPGIEVIAEAGDGYLALELAESLRPEVAVLDIAMPRLNGLEAARRLASLAPTVRVILLSMYQDPGYIRAALRAGVRGYLLKEEAAEELVSAVHRVAQGGYYFAQPVLAAIVAAAQAQARSGPPNGGELGLLSPREREVLQLLAEGRTTSEIAGIIHRSPETVRSHRLRIMRKLKLHSTAELIRFALDHGFIRQDPL
ncbi:MAG: response regulator transcription factor [Candidatus Bipolaricaulia bacterium]